MVHFMLYDLRRPPGILLPVLLPAAIQILHFNILITGGLPDTVQGKASFFSLVRRILLHDHRVVHDQVQEPHVDDDDPLFHADHVGRHTYTAVLIGLQGVLQILADGQVLL